MYDRRAGGGASRERQRLEKRHGCNYGKVVPVEPLAMAEPRIGSSLIGSVDSAAMSKIL